MTLFLSAIFFPIIALVVLFGLGLLVAAAGGNRMRPELVAPAGIALLVVLGQFTAWAGIGTPANVILMVLLALAGYGLLIAKRGSFWPEGGRARGWLWWLVPGILAGGAVLATIIFFGGASMSNFLLDTTSAVQMLGGDVALHGTDNFGHVGTPASSSSLVYGYFGQSSYPYGSQIALALLGSLSGVSMLWIYTPFMGLMLALSAFCYYRIARLFDLARGWSALAAFLAAVPALVYAYALQGSIKEIVFLPLLALLGLLLLDPLLRSTPRSLAVSGAIVGTAAIGVVGMPALGWVAPLGLAALIVQLKRFGGEWSLREAVKALGLTIAVMGVAMIPKLGGLIGQLHLAKTLSQTNGSLAADPGNLFAPLHKTQAFGVWLGGSHRVPPEYASETWFLIGIVALCFAVGLGVAIARRMWTRALWAGLLIVLWYVLTWRGTLWIDAKIVMLSSSLVLILAVFGASKLRVELPENTWPRGARWHSLTALAPGYACAALIAVGVLGSVGLQYLSAGMLPTDRYKELESLDAKWAGKGPAFVPDFDELGLYALRNVRATGPGNAYTDGRYTVYRNGDPVGYGHSVDIDRLKDRSYKDFPLIIQRRSPQRSRPGADYDQVSSGAYYDTFKRNGTKVVVHMPVGNAAGAVAVPLCGAVESLAARAKADDALQLKAAIPGSATRLVPNAKLDFEGPLALGGAAGSIAGPGTISYTATVLPGQSLWWLGTVTRPISVLVDGKPIGSFQYSVSGDGTISRPIALPAGLHKITLVRGGGSPRSGGRAGAALYGLYLAAPNTSQVKTIDPANAKSELCGRPVDWVELTEK